MAGYVILLAAFGIVPVAYGVYFAFTNAGNTFAGLSNFIQSAQDFRYLPAFEHIGLYLVFWLVALVVLAIVVSLLCWLATRQIGGQTGDVLGAVEQVSEIVILLVALR